MTTSIPSDPSLQLGQILDLQRVEQIIEIAEAQKPLDVAQERLNNALATNHRLRMIHEEMIAMDVPSEDLDFFRAELVELKNAVATAAIRYGKMAMETYRNVEAIENKYGQKKISFNIESPLDYGLSDVTKFPLGSDGIEFDVQYIRNEEVDQKSDSHSSQVTSHVRDVSKRKEGFWPWERATVKTTTDTASKTNASMTSQSETHQIEGTIVISATVDHKNAEIISPLVLNPLKAVEAWNRIHPKDELKVDPKNIMEAAGLAVSQFSGKKEGKENKIQIISGSSKGSSFVGFVHLLKTESTVSSQSASSTAKSMKKTVQKDMWFSSKTGKFGSSSSMSSMAKSLTSISGLSNHATIICNGIIPNIVSNESMTVVKSLKPDPKDTMAQLAAISGDANSGVNSSMQSEGEEGKKGAQYMSLNSEYMKNAVSSIDELETTTNKVIDTNSMMMAYQDFVEKAQAGEGGIPTTFFLKDFTKEDIAKIYIRRFYPDGMLSKDKYKGMFGISEEDEGNEEEEEG